MALEDSLKRSPDGDGVVVVALADTEGERQVALDRARAAPFVDPPDVIVGILQPLQGIAAELRDVLSWQWIADNMPELAEDAYAAAEVGRQLTAARRAL